MRKKPTINPEGTVGPRIGAENYESLCKQAKKRGMKPNTLARQLLIFALNELVEGKIEVPPDQAVRL